MATLAATRDRPRLRVGLTGATGLVGTAFARFLRGLGHTVVPFGRHGRPGVAAFDALTGAIDAEALEGLDAMVHLAGAPLAVRWTPAAKARIRDSRVVGTRALAEALAACRRPPGVFVSASAVGFWGHRTAPV
ncbi:MAG: NAD-dependent epimerase/dehydratase family protein, partial [Myxococcales bacterium]|nr:NAD-dependent epimerase/dehydratase family protein [Myxococcales bacterium]